MDKKGASGIGIILPIVLAFGAIAIMIGLTSFALNNIKSTQTADTTEYNATQSVSEGIETFASLFPALGVLVGAIIVIIIIVFGMKKFAG